MRLFTVHTIVTQYRGYKSVPFVWFRRDPPEAPNPDADPFENYEPGDRHPKDTIDDFFKESEANAFKEYLDQLRGGKGITTIKEVDLSIKTTP